MSSVIVTLYLASDVSFMKVTLSVTCSRCLPVCAVSQRVWMFTAELPNDWSTFPLDAACTQVLAWLSTGQTERDRLPTLPGGCKGTYVVTLVT